MAKDIVQSVHDSIEDIFLRRNPGCKRQDLLWRADGRLEWRCKEGIGHTVFSMDDHWTHGCDGCCKNLTKFSIDFKLPRDAVEKKGDGGSDGIK